MVDVTKFGANLDTQNPEQKFLVNELIQLQKVIETDSTLSSLVGDDLSLSIRVTSEGKRFAPQYRDADNSIVYHSEVCRSQENHKGENGIDTYTQSSLYHEIVHAQQYKDGLQAGRLHKGEQPVFEITNAADLLAMEAECKMLNAMYHVRAWQQQGRSVEESGIFCRDLQAKGQEFEHGNTIPEYADVYSKEIKKGLSDEQAHKMAGKAIILSLLSGNYPEWRNMYSKQINDCRSTQEACGFDAPKQEFSGKMLNRMFSMWGITPEELAACQMPQYLEESYSNFETNNKKKTKVHALVVAAKQRLNTRHEMLQKEQPTLSSEKINDVILARMIKNKKVNY